MPQFNSQEIREVIKTLFSKLIEKDDQQKKSDKNIVKDKELCLNYSKPINNVNKGGTKYKIFEEVSQRCIEGKNSDIEKGNLKRYRVSYSEVRIQIDESNITNVEKRKEEDATNDNFKNDYKNISSDKSEQKITSSSESDFMTQSRDSPIFDNIIDNSHEIDTKNENNRGLTCICGKWFRHKSHSASNRYTFKSHIINKHGNSGPEMLHFETIYPPMENKCYFCSAIFDSKTQLTEHKKRYRDGNYWVCPNVNCNTKYRRKSSSNSSSSFMLQGHLKQHSGEFDYSCENCEKKFSQKALYKSHQKVHVDRNLKSLECEICSRTLYDFAVLRVHMYQMHGEAKLPCSQCNKKLRTKKLLQKHNQLHEDEGLFKCNACNQSFKKKITLTTHIVLTHTDDKTNYCSLCDKGFLTPCQLKRHEGLHTGYKPFKCEYCKKAFMLKYNMKYHAVKCSSISNNKT